MTFLWHDYETFGTHPAHDRPCQFAALRTDDRLEPLGEPLSFYCRPPTDALPHPFACLVTGISPQHALREGISEAEFATRIHNEMMEPGTCATGYNSLRFDDEVSRHLFYRNFFDPYEREYRNGNSRWDLIGPVRMCYALRPDGIQWPLHEDGKPSFRLEDLTAANGIGHQGAHDALADVRATVDLARLLRQAQPQLFAWTLEMRNQDRLRQLLDTEQPQMLVHSSGRIPAVRGCTSLVLPLAQLPERKKSFIVVDLMTDPGPLLELDAGAIGDRLFTPAVDLPAGVERIPLKTIAINRCPMLAPAGVLRDTDTGRIGLDPERCRRHAKLILRHLPALRSKLLDIYQPAPLLRGQDPDSMLYSGDFFSPHDRRLMERLRQASPDQLATQAWPFQDSRLPEMLFRYRARNHPDSLSTDELQRWEQQRLLRLHEPTEDGQLGLAAFQEELREARLHVTGRATAQALLDQVDAWVRALIGEP